MQTKEKKREKAPEASEPQAEAAAEPKAEAKAAPAKEETKSEAKPPEKAGTKPSEPKAETKEAPEADDDKPDFLKKKKEGKRAAFDMFIPGQVVKEFYPELQREVIEYPSDDTSPQQVSPDGKTLSGDKGIITDPAAAMGIGRDGKPQILEGAPLRREQDVRGYDFNQEFTRRRRGWTPSLCMPPMRSIELIRRPAKKNSNISSVTS